jgi:hypothetical protein
VPRRGREEGGSEEKRRGAYRSQGQGSGRWSGDGRAGRGRRARGGMRRQREVLGGGAVDGRGPQGEGGGGSNRRVHDARGGGGELGPRLGHRADPRRGGGPAGPRAGGEERERGKDFPFSISYLALNSTPKYFSQITRTQARKSWSSMMQQQKKIFLGFTYTRSRAKSR